MLKNDAPPSLSPSCNPYIAEWLTYSHTTKYFGPDQIESICRLQIKYNKNDNFYL